MCFSIVLVENIPDDLPFLRDGRRHLPLSVGLHTLLDQAKHSVEVVSPVWDLNSWDLESMASAAKQVQSVARQPEYTLPNTPAEHESTAFPRFSVRENTIIF